MRQRLVTLLSATSLLGAVLTPQPLVALEPPTAAQVEQYRKDGSLASRLEQARQIGNHQVDPQLAAGLDYRLRLQQWQEGRLPVRPAPPPNWQGMPTKGDVRVFALLISFSDYAPSNTAASIDGKLFGDGLPADYPRESLRNYYRRASYTQLELQGATLGWYAAPYPRSSVPQTIAGRQALIKEALDSFDAAGHDFSQYDNDGDGAIDYFLVLWTGPDNGWANFWWGYQTRYYDSSYLLDGKRLSKYSWQWETLTAGSAFSPYVTIHETGHALGLPDYYDYDYSVGPRGGVGGLDMMDGNWGDHNCFSKWLLDWITPTVISGGTSVVSLRPSGASGDAVAFVTGATSDSFAEYFMIQNRTRVANDTGYPADGSLVWHVDATLDGGGYRYDNSYTPHKLLRLMEADGLEQIEAGAGANAGDYYVTGRSLTPTSQPSNAKYSGTPNTLQVTDVSAAGNPMTARIGVVADATAPTGVPGTPGDEGATTPLTRLVFTWTQGNVQDAESGVVAYQLQVGTAPGAADVFDGWVGKVLTWTFHDLPEARTYYARVRVANGAGLTSAWSASSDGIAVAVPAFPCAALDNCGLAFRTSGDAVWQVQSSVVHDGATAAQAGDIGDNEATFLELPLVGPGTLSFWWRSSCQGYSDAVFLNVDGGNISYATGETGWTQQNLSLGGGAHVVRWVYDKDRSGSAGLDTGWVDGVVWTPVPTVAIDTRTKAVAGAPFLPGATVTYTIVLANTGNATQADNPGHELVDTLPPELDSITAGASAGVAVVAGSTVTWNGSIASGGSVTITINARVKPAVGPGASVANQATVAFDADVDGVNESATATDDPGLPGALDPTAFTVTSPSLDYYPLVPCRLVDTRDPDGPNGGPALQAGATRVFRPVSRCGIPATARALSINATVTQPTTLGHLRLYPADQALPTASNLNYAPGLTRANNAVVPLSASGELGVYCGQAAGSAHFVLDVNGYFQ